MYHSVLKSKSGTYIIHPNKLENDFKYIKENGYSTITINDLINYVYNDISLPLKPIIITFDDGYYNNLTYAFPLLKKYNMKAVISIIGKYTDDFSNTTETNANYSHLRWVDIQNLMNSKLIEFQNHSYNLHVIQNGRKGCIKKRNESLLSYSNLLSNDLNSLQNKFKLHCNYIPNTFTYPFGAISKESIPIIKSLGFKASLSCESGINIISKDPNCLYLLKRYNRAGNLSTSQFFNQIFKQK